MMDKLATARALRLGAVLEILEACRSAGERVDLDLMAEVLAEGLQDLGPEPEHPQPLDEEEQRVICALSTVIGALRNLTWYLAEQHNPGRARRKLQELPDRIKRQVEEVVLPRVQLMPREQAAEVLLEATRWAYLIWSPAEQVVMFRILGLAAEGKYIPKADRELARQFLDRYRSTMPMGAMADATEAQG